MQGDILKFAPNISIRQDIELLKSYDKNGRSIFGRHAYTMSSFEINRGNSTFDLESGELCAAKIDFGRSVVLSHSCDVESEKVVSIAKIRTLNKIPAPDAEIIRKNENFNYFYLPNAADFEEGYVDFRSVTVIQKNLLMQIPRLKSLSDVALKAFWAQTILHFTHHDILPDIGSLQVVQ